MVLERLTSLTFGATGSGAVETLSYDPVTKIAAVILSKDSEYDTTGCAALYVVLRHIFAQCAAQRVHGNAMNPGLNMCSSMQRQMTACVTRPYSLIITSVGVCEHMQRVWPWSTCPTRQSQQSLVQLPCPWVLGLPTQATPDRVLWRLWRTQFLPPTLALCSCMICAPEHSWPTAP